MFLSINVMAIYNRLGYIEGNFVPAFFSLSENIRHHSGKEMMHKRSTRLLAGLCADTIAGRDACMDKTGRLFIQHAESPGFMALEKDLSLSENNTFYTLDTTVGIS